MDDPKLGHLADHPTPLTAVTSTGTATAVPLSERFVKSSSPESEDGSRDTGTDLPPPLAVCPPCTSHCHCPLRATATTLSALPPSPSQFSCMHDDVPAMPAMHTHTMTTPQLDVTTGTLAVLDRNTGQWGQCGHCGAQRLRPGLDTPEPSSTLFM